MKKLKNLFFVALAAFIFSLTNVKAGGYDFDITANYAWGNDSQLRSGTKIDGTSVSTVIWNTSNKSSHRMWFRVLDMNNNVRGSVRIDYLSSGYAVTNNTTGSSYIIQAKRENIIDPITTVTGKWLP